MADRQAFLETEPLDHVPEIIAEYERQRAEVTEAMEEVREASLRAASLLALPVHAALSTKLTTSI